MSLKRTALGDLSPELSSTRRLLERVPDGHLSWRPHEKSFSLGQLATHIVNLLTWQETTIRQDGLDLADIPRTTEPLGSREEILRVFDERVAAVQAALDELDEAALGATWTLQRGGQVILQQPRLAMLRGLGMNHLVHHRGQLSVYLRLLDVPLPPLYGPTADEAF